MDEEDLQGGAVEQVATGGGDTVFCAIGDIGMAEPIPRLPATTMPAPPAQSQAWQPGTATTLPPELLSATGVLFDLGMRSIRWCWHYGVFCPWLEIPAPWTVDARRRP